MLSDRPADDGAADGAALDPATAAPTETGAAPDTAPTVVPLTEPAEGIPPVVDSLEELARVAAAFEAGTGPVAVDAERASGYRYGQHTYLVQLRREGAGTALVDPIALPDLSILSDALVGVEWVLHAASQDLPGLLEQNLRPSRIFDTELGARLLGLERVGLAAVVAELLGLGLAKEHSAVDWSTRPLPEQWLRYAALDVEVLVELREIIAERLAVAGKAEWAAQEFEAVRTAPPATPRVEPWRRVSGLHAIHDARRLAVVRELWTTREENARQRDISPGRVLPDHAILAAAQALPRSVPQLVALPAFSGKGTRRRAALWQHAIDEGLALPDSELPSVRGPRSDAPPPPRAWPDRDPAAAARLAAARDAVATLSAEVEVPAENLLQPDLLRRLCWTPPSPLDASSIEAFLRAGGARQWQVDVVTPRLVAAFATAAAAAAAD
ncbi:ribonuclease D (plasmid) [Cellulomonas sp. WB94]|uniref:HRDC domain-containing protein n=1 Tax=Cellulomonas sp. WB94 TaxID=2173174 RepID=UPI000D56BF95|nr:HRDC domain-containing protein [Cellulomonas sp. WB94]PVU81836.1 ribonuclease D [Cellulomonas sp. WB94]